MEKYKIGLAVRYTSNQNMPFHLSARLEFEAALCRRVHEAGMEQYRVMYTDGSNDRATKKVRFDFQIVAGVEAPSRKEAEAKALTLLLQAEQAKLPHGIEAVSTALSAAVE